MSAGYSSPTVGYPLNNARPPSAGSAETLVLVALILQVIGGALVIGGIAWLFGFSILFPYPYAWVVVTAATGVAGVVLVFLYFAYNLVYQRIRRGEYVAAQTPTLVIGILSLFAGILPGIFYLIGYVKLGDAIREQQGPIPGYSAAPSGAPGPAMFACKSCGRVYSMGQFAFCPGCGQRLGT